MDMNGNKLKTILRLLFVALILNVIVFFTFTVSGYDMIYDIVKKNSAKNLDIFDKDYSEFENVEKMLKKETIFCVNEHPGVKVNYDILRNNTTFFYNEFNMKYIVIDLSYSEALWANHYMNEENPTKRFRDVLISHIKSQELFDFILEIKEKNVNNRNKIEIIGINIEKSSEMPVSYIEFLFEQFENKRKPAVINEAINFVGETEVDHYRNMYESLLNNERIYKEYFVDKYFSFYMVLRNYINSIDNADSVQIYTDNFADIFNANIRAKYYIQLPKKMNLYENLMIKYPEIADQIFDFTLFYDNCESIDNEDFHQYPFDLYTNDTPQNFILNNKFFKHFEKHRRFVYKINNKNYDSYNTEYGDDYFIFANSPEVINDTH